MNLVIGILLTPLAVLTLCFGVELFVGLKPLEQASRNDGDINDAVVIVPAHNEAVGLRPRLIALRDAAAPARVLVVADNCSDSTASLARQAGVQVVERVDPKRRGKGFALDYARSHLSINPPDIVVIIDADCFLDGGSLQHLIERCRMTGSPSQAINLQRSQPNSPSRVQISTFAFYVKNVIRQRALMRLSGRAQLLGTGMALPWNLFEKANLATASIVEDIKLGQELAEDGYPPVLVEGATIWSEAETTGNTLAQRSRWEGGFINEALAKGPRRLLDAARRRDFGEMWAALSVMIPPFALLMIFDIAVLVLATFVIWGVGAESAALWILGMPLLLAAVGLVLVWLRGGSRFVTLSAMCTAPLYLFWKLPMYIGFVRRGVPKQWNRTDRE